ncbi:MAG: peptide chain release factor N(5)-glutamine methyltransferase, partial [Litorimonas sp.]
SGALALSLLAERGDATALATDCEASALRTAQANAEALGVSDRVDWLRSDWFGAVNETGVDAVVSNPPYIDSAAMEALEPEVARFDPTRALHGGPDGLDPYRIIVPEALSRLRPGGWLGLEIGFDQGPAVAALLQRSGYVGTRIIRDPAGLDRVVSGRRPD